MTIHETNHQRIEAFLGVPLPKESGIDPSDKLRFLEQGDIEKLVLERPPFMWVDHAVLVQPTKGKQVVWGRAHMSAERAAGHFPSRPVVPLLHLCIVMAQTAAIASALQVKGESEPIGITSGDANATAKELLDAPATVLTKCVVERYKMYNCFLNGTVYHKGEEVGTLADMRYLLSPRSMILERH
jgi:3-hydroxymyristoyl/3-hydroxydecanoyl-(acyl carrier protein) dehydratase